MAKLNKEEFINTMLQKISNQINFVEDLSNKPDEELNSKPTPKAWNALECVDHMNRLLLLYTNQLLPMELDHDFEDTVSIGMKGRFFAEGMRPKGEKISYKMSTAKVFTPSKTNKQSLDDFKRTLESAQKFLEVNRNKKWKGKKVTSALGPLVKFNIAEAFNFLLAHNERHILQAQRAMNRT